MKLLLDTHALLWWVAGDDRMRHRILIGDDDVPVFVSAVSAYEIALKFHAGKLPNAATLATRFEAEIERQAFAALPLSVTHGQLAGSLPMAHKDPFDRLLAAQALLEGLTIVSVDAALDQFGVQRLW